MTKAITKDWIVTLSSESLRAIVASTNPNGQFADQFRWAQAELNRRSQVWQPRVDPEWSPETL